MNKNLAVAVDNVYKQNVNNDWDTFWAVVGDEGKGKTNLDLHILERYLIKLKGDVVEEDIKYLALDRDKWSEQLSKSRKYEPSIYDEAGELTNRRVMSKFNVQISQTARVIRGDNNFVILTIQDIFDLDPFFTKRRLKAMIYVYKRGHFAFYSQKRLRRLIAINKLFYVKNYWIVKPTFTGTFGKYKGVLLKPYKKMKEEFIRASKSKLIEEIEKPQKEDEERDRVIELMRQEGMFKNKKPIYR